MPDLSGTQPKIAFRPVAAGLVIALLAGCASGPYQFVRPEPRNEVPDFILFGTWEGPLTATTTDAKGDLVRTPFRLRVQLRENGARVYVQEPGDSRWKEQYPDGFVLDAYGTNAVIYANRAGKVPTPEGSRWFETYLVAASVRSPGELLVHWMRMVTNLDTGADDADRAGTTTADGVLLRK